MEFSGCRRQGGLGLCDSGPRGLGSSQGDMRRGMYGLIRPEHPNLQVQLAKATRFWIQGLGYASCSNRAPKVHVEFTYDLGEALLRVEVSGRGCEGCEL